MLSVCLADLVFIVRLLSKYLGFLFCFVYCHFKKLKSEDNCGTLTFCAMVSFGLLRAMNGLGSGMRFKSMLFMSRGDEFKLKQSSNFIQLRDYERKDR